MAFFSGVWSFFKRHRRKMVLVGAVAGGIAAINYYGRRKLREYQERETNDYFDRMKREQHFESTQKTCRSTINGMLPTFYSKMSVLANCEDLTEQLKSRPSNKLDLWEKLKCTTFARLVSDIYGSSIITTLLNVQLNVIGGYMFLDAVHMTSESNFLQASTSLASHQPIHAPLHIQQRYLALIQQFLEVGCENMYRFIMGAINECVEKVALNESTSLLDLQVILNAVRANFEKAVKEADHTNLEMFAFVISPELLASAERGAEESSWDEIVYNRLINETRDLFESEDCRNVVSQAVDLAFSFVYDHLAGYFVSDGSDFKNPNEVSMPFAKIIPIVCALTIKCFGESSELHPRLFAQQKILAANIYESFSRDNRVGDLRNHNTTVK